MSGKPADQSLFTRRTVAWLTELRSNNNKAWFETHRERYEQDVREPALRYIEQMAPILRRISPHFTAIARRSGGSLMRVHRDMRFSHNQDRYKTNIGIQFRHERGRDVHAPGFYLHVEPGQCFIGAGIWRPESGALKAIRLEIADRPAAWRKVVNAKRFSEKFALSGDALTRPPRGFSADTACIDDIRRKDFIAIASLSDAFVCRRDLPARSGELFSRASALMRFLCAALDLEY